MPGNERMHVAVVLTDRCYTAICGLPAVRYTWKKENTIVLKADFNWISAGVNGLDVNKVIQHGFMWNALF